jgi:hypothetical protein
MADTNSTIVNALDELGEQGSEVSRLSKLFATFKHSRELESEQEKDMQNYMLEGINVLGTLGEKLQWQICSQKTINTAVHKVFEINFRDLSASHIRVLGECAGLTSRIEEVDGAAKQAQLDTRTELKRAIKGSAGRVHQRMSCIESAFGTELNCIKENVALTGSRLTSLEHTVQQHTIELREVDGKITTAVKEGAVEMEGKITAAVKEGAVGVLREVDGMITAAVKEGAVGVLREVDGMINASNDQMDDALRIVSNDGHLERRRDLGMLERQRQLDLKNTQKNSTMITDLKTEVIKMKERETKTAQKKVLKKKVKAIEAEFAKKEAAEISAIQGKFAEELAKEVANVSGVEKKGAPAEGGAEGQGP